VGVVLVFVPVVSVGVDLVEESGCVVFGAFWVVLVCVPVAAGVVGDAGLGVGLGVELLGGCVPASPVVEWVFVVEAVEGGDAPPLVVFVVVGGVVFLFEGVEVLLYGFAVVVVVHFCFAFCGCG